MSSARFLFFVGSWNFNSVNLFLKCGNYNKSRFYEQILKVGFLLLENSFSSSYTELTLFRNSKLKNRRIFVGNILETLKTCSKTSKEL
ncbi:hypothetical protein LEP1GSC062_4190 [Leptospira alexanderi serovar Manhao 3 str. L 60]|uniref:Uncharacterized protein n=1 Tax=Leptospira alexanderi serovar Manhao 3 str. L 60 TaxID=1049759 RepID=V6HZL3_9LEPT|nr:hypothetical protein LEP1GSC062_4190 [Leptospira alexanderi serovar Manhao 3 str. L 60]